MRDALRGRAFWTLTVIQFLTSIAMYSVNPQIVAYLIDQGFTPLAAASAFGVAAVVGTAGVIGFAIVADRLGYLQSVTVSYVMSILGFGVLFLVALYPMLWVAYLFVFIYGPTFGSRGPVVNALTARVFGNRNLGSIMGFIQLGLGLGAAIGATLGGVIHDWLGGYEGVLAMASGCCGFGLLLYWITPEIRRAPRW